MNVPGFPFNSVLIFMAFGKPFGSNSEHDRAFYNDQQVPVLVMHVATRTITAVSYRHRTWPTYIDFRGTELMPVAAGKAKVQSQLGSTKIEATLDNISPANEFGPECMTYVLWGRHPGGPCDPPE